MMTETTTLTESFAVVVDQCVCVTQRDSVTILLATPLGRSSILDRLIDRCYRDTLSAYRH